jgi:hypothetical protein
MGLYFLKAHALYKRPPGRPKGNCASVAQLNDATVAQFTEKDEKEAPEGFDQFLRETFQDTPYGTISRRSAFNYMQAARRLGLTVDSTDEDVERLAQSNALEGKKLSALYALPPADNAKREEKPEGLTPESEAHQLWLPFMDEIVSLFSEGSHYEEALYQMPMRAFEDMERRLRTALDVMVGVKAERTGKAQKQVKSGPARKHQTSSTKHQRNIKHQASSTKA